MKRRNFILLSCLSPLFVSASQKEKLFVDERYIVLDDMFNTIFVKTSTMPSAKEFNAMQYLISNINHETFLSEDKNLLLQGAVDFKNSFPQYFKLKKNKKLDFLQNIQNNNSYAQEWLSKIVYYAIEAMLSDPIYKGNKKKIGWSSINHKIGYPRPKKRYGEKV